MHEILAGLPPHARVLDLGSGSGSFHPGAFPFTTIHADIETPPGPPGNFVRCSAAALPFRSGAFQAAIANHSLEHFEDLDGSLEELGRVVRPGGALFVAVPDAATVTDRLYRWLARGGGHVNPFKSAPALAAKIERATGLRHLATRTMCTSLSFLNRKNIRTRPPRRLLPLGAGTETSLFVMNGLFRVSDRFFGTRASVYGWALYFGNVGLPIDCRAWTNVCIRCGSGHPSAWLRRQSGLRRFLFLRTYRCPHCGTTNLFTDDSHYRHLAGA